MNDYSHDDDEDGSEEQRRVVHVLVDVLSDYQPRQPISSFDKLWQGPALEMVLARHPDLCLKLGAQELINKAQRRRRNKGSALIVQIDAGVRPLDWSLLPEHALLAWGRGRVEATQCPLVYASPEIMDDWAETSERTATAAHASRMETIAAGRRITARVRASGLAYVGEYLEEAFPRLDA